MRRTSMAVILVALIGILVGCGQSSTRVGWVGASSPGHVKATYAEFNGTETHTVLAQPGETLYLDYDAKVDKGSLHLEVDNPYGETVWCASLCEDCGETKELSVKDAGCYTISIWGEATKGSLDLKWEQK